jgi:hypothetical protein
MFARSSRPRHVCMSCGIALCGRRLKVTAAGDWRYPGPQSCDANSPLESFIILEHTTITHGSPSIHPNIITLSRGVSLVPVLLRLHGRLREGRNRGSTGKRAPSQVHRLSIVGGAFSESIRALVGVPLAKRSTRKTINRIKQERRHGSANDVCRNRHALQFNIK